jgi:hypothetical protein
MLVLHRDRKYSLFHIEKCRQLQIELQHKATREVTQIIPQLIRERRLREAFRTAEQEEEEAGGEIHRQCNVHHECSLQGPISYTISIYKQQAERDEIDFNQKGGNGMRAARLTDLLQQQQS